MFPYYFIFVILAFFSFTDVLVVKRSQRLWILLGIWFLLTSFAGLRYNDPDWMGYATFYEQIATGNGEGSADVGFNLLCYFLSLFTSHPLILFVVVASLSVGLNLNSFLKYSPFFLICTLFYFVHLFVLKEMIQIRAGLASAICLLSIRYLIENQYKKFILIWLLAISVHLTAVIFFLVFIMHCLKPSRKMLIYLLVICILIGVFYPFGQIIKSVVGLNGIEMGRLNDYIAYGDEKYGGKLGVFSNINTIKYLLISVILLFYNSKLSVLNKYYYILLCSYITGTCWLLLFNDFSIVGARLSNILTSVEPILISYLCFLFVPNSRWFCCLCIIVLAFVILQFNMGPDRVEPYQFYFSL
ncbi:EpsG family protein [Bacteroides bouchesdurhonensis]